MGLTEEGLIKVDGFASRWVRLPGGVKAHYQTAGDTGPAVVLLHGGIIGSSGIAGWRFMAPFLATNGFRVYCPDMPSFGLTEDPEEFYQPGWVGHVDFLHDFTSALCLDRFHMAGNSMGCQNTVNYVVAHPERVESYALIAGSIGDIVSDEVVSSFWKSTSTEKKGDSRNNTFDGTATSMKQMMGEVVLREGAVDDDLLEMRTLIGNRTRPQFDRHRERMSIFPLPVLDQVKLSTQGRFDRLDIPGIYLYGMDDTLMPVEFGYLQEDRLPNVQFFYPENCGHQGQTDQPEMFNQVFLEFFRDGQVTRQTADWAGVSKRRAELETRVDQL
ncbi:MAG: alpha/beta hydrolase [Pseudonocardia sp.]|nr:MAG: alpha/beta hydrolase [Pseudonocardia sp.]